MFLVNLAAVQTAVATRLPAKYEPLALTFYGLGSRQKGDHITFGSDGAADLCVNARDGRVCAKDPSGKAPDRFVNTTFEQFISFFKTYAECPGTIRPADLRPALEAIDRDALGGPGRYWEPLVESAEEENR